MRQPVQEDPAWQEIFLRRLPGNAFGRWNYVTNLWRGALAARRDADTRATTAECALASARTTVSQPGRTARRRTVHCGRSVRLGIRGMKDPAPRTRENRVVALVL